MNELYQENKDQGLVLIGIHTEGDAEKMPAFVAKAGIEFPVCVDTGAIRDFGVDSYPDYYLIDRAGKVRVADLGNGSLDEAVAMLLAEPAPLPLPGDAACENERVLLFKNFPGESSGNTRAMTTSRGDEPGTIEFHDTHSITKGSEVEALTIFTGAAQNDALLSPIQVNASGTDVDGLRSYAFESDPEGIRVTIKSKREPGTPEEEKVLRAPHGLVLDALVPRIVTQLPMESGYEIEFPMLSILDGADTLRAEVKLVCTGIDKMQTEASPDLEASVWGYELVSGEEVLHSYSVQESSRTISLLRVDADLLLSVGGELVPEESEERIPEEE